MTSIESGIRRSSTVSRGIVQPSAVRAMALTASTSAPLSSWRMVRARFVSPRSSSTPVACTGSSSPSSSCSSSGSSSSCTAGGSPSWSPSSCESSRPLRLASSARDAIARATPTAAPTAAAAAAAFAPVFRSESSCSAIDRHLPDELETFEQVVLHGLVLRLRELARLVCQLGLREETADRRLVAELVLGVVHQALGDPDRAAKRREREQEEPGEEAHSYAPPPSWTKWCGARGPVSLYDVVAACLRASFSIAESTCCSCFRSTRNAPRNTS